MRGNWIADCETCHKGWRTFASRRSAERWAKAHGRGQGHLVRVEREPAAWYFKDGEPA